MSTPLLWIADARRPPGGFPRSLPLKVLATAIWLLLAPLAWIPLTASKAAALVAVDLPLIAGLYVVTATLGILAVAGAPFVRNSWLRVPMVCVFLVPFLANYIAVSVQGEPLSTDMLATLIQARHQADLAVETYGRDLLVAILMGSALAPFLLAQPPGSCSLGTWFLLVPASALGFTFFFVSSFTGRVEEFPSPIAVPIQTYVASQQATVYLGARDPLVYEGPIAAKAAKIIFIVDESVRGDYLQLNDGRFDNTPFLTSIAPRLANFGVATSYSNCSATARMALRSGAREEDFPDPGQRLLRQPALWQFAQRAGFRTVYIDTWLSIRRMSSMLTYDELNYIDRRTGVSLSPYWEVDNRVADEIVAELKSPGPALLFVEKIGVHVPYARNLPPNPGYSPARLTAGNSEPDAARASLLREYSIGIWHRVDRFFERLLPAIEGERVLLIYTSDHGQALFEGGYEASNCSGTNAVRGEGLVPLFVFSTDETLLKTFQESAARSSNRAMHSDIFPTLLWAMGFELAAVEPRYSPGLLDLPTVRTRRFFVFSPFTDRMNWIDVD